MKTELQSHPLADQFPLMDVSGDDYKAFRRDIKTNGQKVKIVLFEGKILDGRNRYQACKDLGIEPLVEEFKGSSSDAAVYVLALNLHHRHLTRNQIRTVILYKIDISPELSDRAIADEVNVDHKTVAKVRKEKQSNESGGENPHREQTNVITRVGKDGVEQTIDVEKAKAKALHILARRQAAHQKRQQSGQSHPAVSNRAGALAAKESDVDEIPGPKLARIIQGIEAIQSHLSELLSSLRGKKKLTLRETHKALSKMIGLVEPVGNALVQLAEDKAEAKEQDRVLKEANAELRALGKRMDEDAIDPKEAIEKSGELLRRIVASRPTKESKK